MPDKTDWTTICPHCGYASEDSAMCRCCGQLIDEALPVRTFSISKFFRFSSAVGQKTNWAMWSSNNDVDLDEKLRTHPSYAFNPGNIFHNSHE